MGAPAASAGSMTGGRTSRCGGVRHDLKARRFQVAPRSWGSACSRRPLAAPANPCGSKKQAGLSAAEADSEPQALRGFSRQLPGDSFPERDHRVQHGDLVSRALSAPSLQLLTPTFAIACS